jgi:hypothetical protein
MEANLWIYVEELVLFVLIAVKRGGSIVLVGAAVIRSDTLENLEEKQ